MSLKDVMESNTTCTTYTTCNKSVDTQDGSGVRVGVAGDARIQRGLSGISGDLFFSLARALWLRGQQDAPLALALIAWGEANAPDAVNAIADRPGDSEWVRRCLGSLARKMARNAPEALDWHAADDPETLAILRPYIEKKPTPEWMTWADKHVAYKLDRHDLAVIEHIRTSDQREREAIQSEPALTSPSGSPSREQVTV